MLALVLLTACAAGFTDINGLPVEALVPIPIPRSIRHAKSCFQLLLKALPMTGQRQKFAEKNIVPRRPQRALRGSESQQPKRDVPI